MSINAKDIEVIHSDEAVLVVNKPAGLLSLPDRYDATKPHLAQVLYPLHGDVWIVHRLDLDTSGVVVLARTVEAHQKLNDQFAAHALRKTYHAIVEGTPGWESMTIDYPLAIDADARHRTVVDRNRGKESVTDCQLLESFGGFALIQACPRTGRTHQIRVHLAAAGFPVIADPLYGAGKALLLSTLKGASYHGDRETEKPLMGRLGLHAASLRLKHPLTDEEVTYTAGYPRDFSATIKQLRKYGRSYRPLRTKGPKGRSERDFV
jgi:RluA family pseudouridine synthase